jgi:ElaB/YqjD/DUF883 family membrane-anchored ribosome-binding protein
VDNPTQELTATTSESPKTPEHYEQAMLQTRESLTEKVSALESQVVGTVQNAADALTGTVGAVKSLMDTAPTAVSDTVKQAASVMGDKIKEVFDVSRHVQNNPWGVMAASVGVGFLTGLLVFRERAAANQQHIAPVYTAPPTVASSTPSTSSVGGLFDDLTSMLGRKVRELAETALDSAATAANQSVRDKVPKLVDAATEAAETRLNGAGRG